MFTLKHYPYGGGSDLHHVWSCKAYTVYPNDGGTFTISMRGIEQPEIQVLPGQTLFIENSAGKTIETFRGPDPDKK